jgi:hypothetical protein
MAEYSFQCRFGHELVDNAALVQVQNRKMRMPVADV